jgi:hypothetical protein
MSDIELSFEQLREDIFDDVLSSIRTASFSDLHTVIICGQDPRQLVLPRPDDALLLSQYGTLGLQFNVPGQDSISLNIVLTMGRLGYAVKVHEKMVEHSNLGHKLKGLAGELGLHCDVHHVGQMVRHEYCNEPSLVWASTTLDILRSDQLEDAFKEFVLLQVDRLIIGIANLLAAAGFVEEAPAGEFAICQIRHAHNQLEAEQILNKHFEIVTKDERNPTNVLYGLVSENESGIERLCRQVQAELKNEGYVSAFRHSCKHLWSIEQGAAT